MQNDDKKREQRQRRAHRARWLSVLSWGTVVTSIAGFFAIWHGISTTSSGPSSSSSSASQQSSGGATAGTSVGRHHRHSFGGSAVGGFDGSSGYGTSSGSSDGSSDGFVDGTGGSGGSQGAGPFYGGGNPGTGSAGLAPSQTPDFRSGAS